ncbi:MAG TPA: hypothetical protein ENK32_12800 [Anaerolineae bacterium]|nr:hypothetical protein [Anaerolineae bacterium]
MTSSFISRDPVFDQQGFIGRAAELAWAVDLLGRPSPQNCNFIGEPRAGKTSLLYQVYARRLGLAPGVKGLYVWLRLAELPDYRPVTFWRAMLSRLAAEAGRPAPELPEEAQDVFDELDEAVEALVEEEGYGRIVFLVDDFDLLQSGIGSRDLDWLRSLATRYGETMAFVISSSEPVVELEDRLRAGEESAAQVSLFANTLNDRWLALLPPEEAEQLCRETAAAEQQSPLTGKEIAFLLAEAGQHPALLKIAAAYLFEARRYESGPEMLENVREDVRLDRHVVWLCRQLWQRRSPAEQAVLAQVLRGEEVSDRITLRHLTRHLGLLEKREGELALFADAFAYWVGQLLNAPEDTAVTAPLVTDELLYDSQTRMVRVDGREVRLTSLEGRLLDYFLAHKNEVCTVENLLGDVWGPGKSRSVVEKAVNRLRTKVERDPKRPRFILSARGEGYLLRLP